MKANFDVDQSQWERISSGSDSSVVEPRVSDRKVADSWFDSRPGSASLHPWERHCILISHCGQAVCPQWWPSLTKDLQTEPKLGCSALV